MKSKKVFIMVFVSILYLSKCTFASGRPTEIYVDNKIVPSQGKHYMLDNRCLIELRFACDMLDCSLEYNNGNIIINKGDIRAELKVNSNIVETNKNQYTLSSPLTINNGRTYIMLKDFCTILGIDVTYDNEIKGICLWTPNNIEINDTAYTNTADAYLKAIYEVYDRNNGLYSTLKYVAIDVSNMRYLSDEARTQLIEGVKPLAQQVMVKSKVQLIKEGFIKEGAFTDGFVICIDDSKSNENQLILSIELWHSTLGSCGCKEIVLEQSEEEWKIISSKFWFMS